MPVDRGPGEIDQLLERDVRVRRHVPIMPTDGPIPATKIAALRKLLDERMRAGLSQSDLADAIDTNATYISNLLTNAATIPPATRDETWRRIAIFLEQDARAAERERPAGFVRTTVAERFIAVCEHLVTRPDMGLVYGPAGIGKSETARAVLKDFPSAVLVRCHDRNRTPVRFIAALGDALLRRRGNRRSTYRQLVDRLRMGERVRVRSLLMIDEAHELPPATLNLIRALHDEARCSVLFIGTVDVKRLVSTDADEEHGQLSSRVGMRVNLAPEACSHRPGGGDPLIKLADIRQIFDRAKVRLSTAAARLLMRLANEPGYGALRRVDRLYDWALRAAEQKGASEITVDHILLAQRVVEEEIDVSGLIEDGCDSRAVQTG